MPLIHSKSKKALSKNIATEMRAHPDKRKQDIAIAYSVQRQARKKKASGGAVQSGSKDMNMAGGGGIQKRYEISKENLFAEEHRNIANDLRRTLPNVHPDKAKTRQAKIDYHDQEANRTYNAKGGMIAEGGSISASNEKRPMPNDLHDDSLQANQNRGNKPSRNDGWTDRPTEAQAMANDVRGKKLPIKRPKMVPTNAFSTRLYDQEGQLEESASPGSYGEQPSKWHDEEDAKASGHPVRDMEDEHSTHRKPYAKGGEVEPKDYEHPDNKYEHGEYNEPMSQDEPSEDEGNSLAMSDNEEGPDRQGPAIPDMEDEHSTGRKPYAGGGKIQDSEKDMDMSDEGEGGEPSLGNHSFDDSEDQPEEEADLEHHNSITAAIMARRDRLHAEIDSGAHDMDSAVRMADGGILSHDSIYSDNSED